MFEMNKILVWIFATILLAECIFAGTITNLNIDTIKEISNKLGAKDSIRFSLANKEINAAVAKPPDIKEFMEYRLDTFENINEESDIFNLISNEIISMNGPRSSQTDNFAVMKTLFFQTGSRSKRIASLKDTLQRLKIKMAHKAKEFFLTPRDRSGRTTFIDDNENSGSLYVNIRNYNIEDITTCINGAYDMAMKECVQDNPVRVCSVYSFVCGFRILSVEE